MGIQPTAAARQRPNPRRPGRRSPTPPNTTRSATPPPGPGASPPRTSPAAATRTPRPGSQEERRYLRLLLIMVGVIIAAGFVLGILVNAISVMTAG